MGRPRLSVACAGCSHCQRQRQDAFPGHTHLLQIDEVPSSTKHIHPGADPNSGPSSRALKPAHHKPGLRAVSTDGANESPTAMQAFVNGTARIKERGF